MFCSQRGRKTIAKDTEVSG